MWIYFEQNCQSVHKLTCQGSLSLVKLAEHNRIKLISVPGHMEIDQNETADQLAREGSSHPFT